MAVTRTEISEKRTAASPAGHESRAVLLPAGAVVLVSVRVNGVEVGTLGPWTATARAGKTAIAKVILFVSDDFAREALRPVAEPIEAVERG